MSEIAQSICSDAANFDEWIDRVKSYALCRVLDTDLAQALGMAQPLNIRQVIKANAEELASFGLVHAAREPYTSGRGRVDYREVFYLNEEQALLVCLLSRTERAKQVRVAVASGLTKVDR